MTQLAVKLPFKFSFTQRVFLHYLGKTERNRC